MTTTPSSEIQPSRARRLLCTLAVDALAGETGSTTAPLLGPIGATRAPLLLDCPEQLAYRDWPLAEPADAPFPDDRRSVYWGCGRMEHLGGALDPTNALLIVLYPTRGTDGQWPSIDYFVTVARIVIGRLFERNQFFRDNAANVSFYALADERVREESTFGGCQSPPQPPEYNGRAGTETVSMGDAGLWYWRTRGAAYGPVPRFRFSGTLEHRDQQFTRMIVPDMHVGLLYGACPGWANYPGKLVVSGTRFSSYVGLAAHELPRPAAPPWCDGPDDCEDEQVCLDNECLWPQFSNSAINPVGDRIAHELGHALGGLADEYGTSGGIASSRSASVAPSATMLPGSHGPTMRFTARELRLPAGDV